MNKAFLDLRKKEMLYKKWSEKIWEPIDGSIYQEMKKFPKVDRRKRSMYKEYLRHCNKKVGSVTVMCVTRCYRLTKKVWKLYILLMGAPLCNYSPNTPVLQQLHWLPVQSRISFKILLLTFQCLHNMAPSYLQELLKKYTPARNLRSSQKNLLECPILGTRFYGEHAFSFGGPLLWNAVPLHLKRG